MKITDAYTIYVSVDTLQGHRWLFYNALNVDQDFMELVYSNGIGNNKNMGSGLRGLSVIRNFKEFSKDTLK